MCRHFSFRCFCDSPWCNATVHFLCVLLLSSLNNIWIDVKIFSQLYIFSLHLICWRGHHIEQSHATRFFFPPSAHWKFYFIICDPWLLTSEWELRISKLFSRICWSLDEFVLHPFLLVAFVSLGLKNRLKVFCNLSLSLCYLPWCICQSTSIPFPGGYHCDAFENSSL